MTPNLEKKLPAEWVVPKPESGWHTQAALADDWAACKEVTREHATSFFFASFPLPEAKKRAAYAIYALCRWCDDIIDEGEGNDNPPEKSRLLKELDAIEAGKSSLPFARAVNEVNHQYAIPRVFWEDLIEGVCMDRQSVIIHRYEELEVYCYHVASVVGLIMSKVFGLSDPAGVPHAVDMGIAMQLTNILRDVLEDFLKGRIYLPLDEMREYNTGPEAIAAKRINNQEWDAFMQMQVDRANKHYRSAEIGLSYLANDGSRFTTKLMSRVYGGILGEIEKNKLNVFAGRLYVPTWKKVLIALNAVMR
ncbi:phytoene/squalene synthase family protein [Rubellicoccus peritrichatus]|uniref:Phytoene/squalene synthase family protein n=1 Tax=Rubellicoccus peritrichatus TaxID=3080537 RepID=A0AAQ3L7I7_9BACT|nr:phytoene/squalene synthase family protein [Puniceicoccus sp. CR14]WOO41054.1 phytoene/squalene synthase family protein [Puniceicoccus sp. CR14]